MEQCLKSCKISIYMLIMLYILSKWVSPLESESYRFQVSSLLDIVDLLQFYVDPTVSNANQLLCLAYINPISKRMQIAL